MEVQLKVTDKIWVKFNSDDQRTMFEEVSKQQEIFSNTNCEACGGDSIRYVVRNVDDNKYYELHCQNHKCRAKLAFGCHKKGNSLFPKRKGDDDKYLENNGWVVWKGGKKDE